MRIIFLILVCLFFIEAGAQNYVSRWQNNAITVNGDITDWDERPGFYDAETSILYGFRNDSVNLYLSLEISNKSMQQKAMHAGLEVKLALKTKPKRNVTISLLGQPNPSLEENKRDDLFMQEGRQAYKLSASSALFEGFVHKSGSVASGNGENNALAYDVDWDKMEAMIFEFRIPLSQLFLEADDFGTMQTTKFSFVTSFAALEAPGGQQAPGGMGGPSGGGQGMGGPPPGGGGGHGGPPQGGMQAQDGTRQLMSTEQRIKCKFTLGSSL